MRSIGIDIGTSSIKVVELNASSKGVQVTQYFEHPLDLNPNKDSELDIIEFLRSLSLRYDPQTTRFSFALRQDRVSVRHKVFPFTDRLKISKSLPFELEEDIPFSADNAVFDARIIRTRGDSAEVLACATPKHHVEKAVKLAEDSLMPPGILSAEAAGLASLFERYEEAPPALPSQPLELDSSNISETRQISVLLHIGHSRTIVCAMENGSLVGCRSLLWGGKNIAEALSKKYEIPYLEAIREMQNKAFILTKKQGASFDQITFSDTIAKAVREMVRDLQLSLLELKSELNAQVTQIQLTGGVSQIQNLGAFLTQMLEVPVNRVQPFDRFPNTLFDKSPQIQARFCLALGLAIEGLRKPRNPALNFLRGEFAKQNQFLKSLWEKWGRTMQISAAALAIGFVYTIVREDLSLSLADKAQDVLSEQAKTVAKLPRRQANEAGIRKYIRDNKKRAADLKTIAGISKMNSAMEILKNINDAIPAKSVVTLDVRQLKVQDSQVFLEGYLNSTQELELLQQSLKNIAVNGRIEGLRSNLGPFQNKTAFAVRFQVDRGIERVTK